MMIGDLEYFMASLPYLRFENTAEARHRIRSVLQAYAGEEEGADTDLIELLDREASKFLPARARAILGELQLERIHEATYRELGNRTLATFSRYMQRLREEVRTLRQQRRAGTERPERDDPDAIYLEGNPLEQEVQLLRYQWEKLEELSSGHYADQDALLLYKLKLLLLRRWWAFDGKLGFSSFLQRVEAS